MNMKEAARTAKEYVADLYAGEEITDIGLEEVEFNDRLNDWVVTIGFSRPWDQKNQPSCHTWEEATAGTLL